MNSSQQTWQDGTRLPEELEVLHPWTSRRFRSRLLFLDNGPAGPSAYNAKDKEVYGDSRHPIAFRVGNGGAGYTGVLKLLCETFIRTHGDDFRIGWVTNHSRFTQIALLADVVQVALTYEPHLEDVSIDEGWAARVGKIFNDHFLLVGPATMQLGSSDITGAMRAIAARGLRFHSRGDGSATWTKEQTLLRSAGIDSSNASWIKTHPHSPLAALEAAEQAQAFSITDRSTFLTAQRQGLISSLRVHVEGGKELLNPCAALINVGSCSNHKARLFAEWLGSAAVQKMIRDFGKDGHMGQALFTPADQEEFAHADRLDAEKWVKSKL